MKTESTWEDARNLPAYDGQGWAIATNHVLRDQDIEDVRTAVQHWLPPGSLLVGAPGSSRFMPPVSIPEFRGNVLQNVARNSKKIALAFVSAGVLIAVGGFAGHEENIFAVSSIFVLFGILFFTDYYIGLRTESDVFNRAMFFRWIKKNEQGRIGLIVWLMIGMVIGVTQLYLQKQLGGIDNLFDKYGAMYAPIRDGQFWRLLSGPYFHYSVTHYSLNVLLLIFIGTLSWAMNGSICIFVFVFGNSFGAWAQMVFGGDLFNNFGGVSPGVYALFGFFLLSAAIRLIKLPRGFGFLCGGLAALGLLGSWLLSKNAANVAHLSGFLLGAFICLLVRSIYLISARPQR